MIMIGKTVLLFATLMLCGSAVSAECGDGKDGAKAAPESVNASSFGFDAEDATECLQKAIDSGAKKVIVENMGKPWIVRPLKLRSDLHLLFKAGVVVEAKKDEFRDKRDALFDALNCTRITLEGEEGAVLRMRKKDYQDPAMHYSSSQWRHTVRLTGCFNVTIRNLTLASSGGDGICIGRSYGRDGRIACRNILIENCVIDDHHRQGISVCSAIGLTIRNCTISNTRGTEPEAGIDFEPDYPDEKFINILVEDCRFIDNHWSGINFSIASTDPVGITVRNCTLYSKHAAPQLSFCMLEPFPKSGGGLVKIENCKVENMLGSNVLFMNFPATANYKVELKDVELIEREGRSGKTAAPSPVVFTVTNPKTASVGGVRFDNVKITGYREVPVFNLKSFLGGKDVTDVTGTINHNGSYFDAAEIAANDDALHRPPWKPAAFEFKTPPMPASDGGKPLPAILHQMDAVMLAEAGKKMTFAVEHRFYDGVPGTRLRGFRWNYQLISPSGKVIDLPACEFPQSGPSYRKDFEVMPEESGLYVLKIGAAMKRKMHRQAVLFHAGPDLRWGLRGCEAQEGCLSFRNQPGLKCPELLDGVFEVPAGVTDFWIDSYINGLTVTDPSGREFTLPPVKGQLQRLKVKRPDAEKAEVWKIRTGEFVMADLLFSGNLPGIIAQDETRLPRAAAAETHHQGKDLIQ